jgi:hypothetical protein
MDEESLCRRYEEGETRHKNEERLDSNEEILDWNG